ncbi:MAG TPA: hypothetical protein VNZ01_14980 [Solirubrobacteraceae bacterium]|jgi:hypothetical protein|nr:hypothetical protein [Solirubrobacteraceae bacterium]
MARSGKRARNLKALLSRVADVREKPTVPRPAWDDLVAAGVAEEVTRVYRMLGGVHEQPRVAPGPWDLQIGEVVVELDEENHFNRFRTLTLASPVYRHLDHVDTGAYRELCANYEAACLTYGGYWTTPSSEREFGPAGRRPELSGSGAPRWKQRAFYDFIKDLTSTVGPRRVVRVSIYEPVACRGNAHTLAELLRRGDIEQLCSDGWAQAIANRLGVRPD